MKGNIRMYDKKIISGMMMVLIAVLAFADRADASDTYRRRKLATQPNNPEWQGKLENQFYRQNAPNAADRFNGNFAYGRDYSPGSPDIQTHPGYAKESLRTPDWMKKHDGKWVSLPTRVSLLRDPSDPQNSVILKLESEDLLQTCARPGDIEYEREVNDRIYLDITVLGFAMDQSAGNVPGCKPGQYRPSAMIPLSRQELASIRQIRFRTFYQIDYYNVVIEDNYLAIRPVSGAEAIVMPLQDPRFDDPLGHWFYPENTVLLYMGSIPANMDVRQEIDRFAYSRGLTPLSQIDKSFRPGVREQNLYYFVDPTGRLPLLINENEGKALEVGSLVSQRTVRNVSGEKKIPVEHAIFARMPGYYE